jgi:hypothetical protein
MSPEELAKDSSAQPTPENSARKLPVSERKIQANRRNALLSTGPKTARGKRTVARNGIKHGFFTREVVITAGNHRESQEELDDLVEEHGEYYEPVGVVEELLVKTIAIVWWNKARIVRAQNRLLRFQDCTSERMSPTNATDKFIRYEAHLDRQLYRAMDQLERLQRQHRGETVPPASQR